MFSLENIVLDLGVVQCELFTCYISKMHPKADELKPQRCKDEDDYTMPVIVKTPLPNAGSNCLGSELSTAQFPDFVEKEEFNATGKITL